MVYCGTSEKEIIWVSSENDSDGVHYIELLKSDDEPVFYVTTCCNEDWIWVFRMDGVSNYEMIKYTIIDAALKCDNMGELINALDEIFIDDFEDLLVKDENEDKCNCENCNHRDCLN